VLGETFDLRCLSIATTGGSNCFLFFSYGDIMAPCLVPLVGTDFGCELLKNGKQAKMATLLEVLSGDKKLNRIPMVGMPIRKYCKATTDLRHIDFLLFLPVWKCSQAFQNLMIIFSNPNSASSKNWNCLTHF
jgi:hypothetical protein